jgi:hypothetical protein
MVNFYKIIKKLAVYWNANSFLIDKNQDNFDLISQILSYDETPDEVDMLVHGLC